MRLIDADAIPWFIEGIGEIPVITKEEIDEMPTIDAVPVIRCKDCKYYGRVDKRRFYRGNDCINGHISTIVPEKDFCSRAERKDSDETN